MSRGPFVVGVSLKMYFGYQETLTWCTNTARIARQHKAITDKLVDLFVLPSSPIIGAAAKILAPAGVAVGAQNLWYEDSGPFTGEVSGAVLKAIGCDYVAIGHSERRTWFGETEELVGKKVAAALRNDLIPVLCVGEMAETSVESAAKTCIDQLDTILQYVGNDEIVNLVVAYEPVWAIGRTSPAPPEQTQAVAGRIKDWLDRAARIHHAKLIYGGSAGRGLLVNLANSVDGLFLGRFVHHPPHLEAILDEIVNAVAGTD